MARHDSIVASFANTTQNILDNYAELLLAVNKKRKKASLTGELAKQTALSLTVVWETFINDMLLNYAEQDPARVLSDIRFRISQSIGDRFGRVCARHVKYIFPRRPTSKIIAGICDDKEKNITAQSAADLSKKANALLTGQHARLFTLDKRDAEFYDFVVSLRNYLGHMSKLARRELRGTLSQMTHPDNAIFKVAIRKIGIYLKAQTPVGSNRIVLIGQRLVELAKRM